MYQEFSNKDYKIIADKILKNIYQRNIDFKSSIFLCGADKTKNTTIRYKISEIMNKSIWYAMSYDLVYPEDLFDELLYSTNSSDLLNLENLLADSVDAVVIIPESPGSFAELGAFANNSKLQSKIVCVLEEKYRRDKSFINQGPVKLIKAANKEGVVYINPKTLGKFNNSNSFALLSTDEEVNKILSAVRKIKKTTSKSKKITLLQLDKFLLPAIYLLEPVRKKALIDISSIAMDDQKFSNSATITALTTLTKKKFIELTPNGYKLTQLGNDEFLSFRSTKSRYKQPEKTQAIDELRLEILNLKFRGKKLKI